MIIFAKQLWTDRRIKQNHIGQKNDVRVRMALLCHIAFVRISLFVFSSNYGSLDVEEKKTVFFCQISSIFENFYVSFEVAK